MTDGIINISTHSLIALHRDAENIPLRSRSIRARMAGNYLSAFKGRGMEFDEARLYQAGDDVRSIDWRLTARSGKPHTKLFREERERPVLLWVDYRRPMFFGTQNCYKSVLAAKTAALLAWSSIQQNDRLGGLIFSEQQHMEIRPQPGKAASLHMMQQLAQHPAWQQNNAYSADEQAATALHALNRLRSVAKPGSLIFLISDFRDINTAQQSALAQLARHNELALLFISDPLEAQLPDKGLLRFSNGLRETLFDSGNKKTRDSYQQRFESHRQQLKKMCRQYGMLLVELSTAQTETAALVKTLHQSLAGR